jgi:hypothetical protein
MVRDPVVECSFLIPIRSDANLADGEPHDPAVWEWLEKELDARFDGWSVAPGEYAGSYTDPDTRERVSDKSIRYFVALPRKSLGRLRRLLAEACVQFQQKCIYLSAVGLVEFIEGPRDGP